MDHVRFQTSPPLYRHWRLITDGPVATLVLDVDEAGGLVPGYDLKLNSYDLGVDIELYDAVQRLRFEHPEVRSVVVTSGKEKVFCAGANIRMLAASSHPWKVNFCKFTNETRGGIEDATENSGQTWIAALNGTASGGGYELALACDRILLVDDRSSVVSLPELPLLGVLPGTGGLTRVTDKRHVRRDLADYFSTRSEGIGGKRAVAWKLVDELVPRARWQEVIAERARASARSSTRLPGGQGIELTPLDKDRQSTHAMLSGTTGVAVPGYDLKLVDEDTGRAVTAAGQPGTLFVRGASAATGYWARYDASRLVFQGEWLRTGDTYVRDDDGYYECLGRTGDMIKASGIWVSPRELESRLLAHPAVAQAAVVAAPDADGLEKPVAYVILAPGATVTEAELIGHCREGLPSYQRPRAIVFTDAFPTTATGKVRRVELRELAAGLLRPPTR